MDIFNFNPFKRTHNIPFFIFQYISNNHIINFHKTLFNGSVIYSSNIYKRQLMNDWC